MSRDSGYDAGDIGIVGETARAEGFGRDRPSAAVGSGAKKGQNLHQCGRAQKGGGFA